MAKCKGTIRTVADDLHEMAQLQQELHELLPWTQTKIFLSPFFFFLY